MLELICAIPEEFGWACVGSLATMCVYCLVRLVKCVVEEIKIRREEADWM